MICILLPMYLVDYLSDLNLYHRINAKVYIVQIITGSNVV